MNEYEYGPIDTYEIKYKSGDSERIQAHQVTPPRDLFFEPRPRGEVYTFHGKVDGRWKLILTVQATAVHSVRLITRGVQ